VSGLIYYHLDEEAVRRSMLEGWEAERDELIAAGAERDCYGRDLTDQGWEAFLDAMPTALIEQTDALLTAKMEAGAYWQMERWINGADG
jgi:hypothetical protein